MLCVFDFVYKMHTRNSGSPIPFFGPMFLIHQRHPVRMQKEENAEDHLLHEHTDITGDHDQL